ncbi:MAG TPA: BPSS1780 family membrane protein [Pelomicrobium sp.]|nr:BPSS1780 family membrane protein [Pelomicrobium sp.]
MRQLPPTAGWDWIVRGFALFRKSPLNWILICTALMAIGIVLSMVPYLGVLLFYLLSPVFLAGVMLGAEALDQGRPLLPTYLLEGFRRGTSALVTVGGVYLVGQVVIDGVVQVMGGAALQEFVQTVQGSEGGAVPEMPRELMLALLTAAALSVPLVMAVWFAPLLVIFAGMLPFASLKLSFGACLANILPLTVYAFILMALGFVALIPAALGLVILVPVVFASIYVSYRDIFVAGQEAPAADNG